MESVVLGMSLGGGAATQGRWGREPVATHPLDVGFTAGYVELDQKEPARWTRGGSILEADHFIWISPVQLCLHQSVCGLTFWWGSWPWLNLSEINDRCHVLRPCKVLDLIITDEACQDILSLKALMRDVGGFDVVAESRLMPLLVVKAQGPRENSGQPKETSC